MPCLLEQTSKDVSSTSTLDVGLFSNQDPQELFGVVSLLVGWFGGGVSNLKIDQR